MVLHKHSSFQPFESPQFVHTRKRMMSMAQHLVQPAMLVDEVAVGLSNSILH